MVQLDQSWESRQSMVGWWLQTWHAYPLEWFSLLQRTWLEGQAHGLTTEQRTSVDQISATYSDILQQILTHNLQNLSFNSEVAERQMEFLNKILGTKT